SGSAAKKNTSQTVNFHNPLSSPDPAVLLTPFWQGSTKQVGSMETLDAAAASEIIIVSGNMATNNYLVNYLAIDLGITTMDNGNRLVSGIANKTGGGKLRVYFPTPLNNPIVFISPWWNLQNTGVGYVETLVTVTPEYF